MTDERSGDVGQLNGLRRRCRSLRLCLTSRCRWLIARGSSWRARGLHGLSATPGAIHRRLRAWEAASRPVIHDCLASERAARLVALSKKPVAFVKKIESRYPWRRWVRQTGHCCQRGWMLALAQFKAGIGRLQNWTAGNRFLAGLRNKWTGLVDQIGRSQGMQWVPGAYRRVLRWCGRLARYTEPLTSAWPSTIEITGEITGETTRRITGTAPADKRFQEPGVWVDSESPLGYARQVWSTRARDAYSAAGQNPSWGNILWADGDCPIGYARIAAEYFPPPELECEESGFEEPEVAEFQPDHFLLDLFRAYSQLLEQRGDSSPGLAPVVPLVDVFALLSSVRSVSPEYSSDDSPDYTREDFIKDVYRLHASGVDTTLDGARISFPISRGVKGKTLTVTDEAGDERRYYGVRFLGQVTSG